MKIPAEALSKLKAWRPALPPVAAEFLHRHFKSYSTGFLVWSSATAICTILLVLLLVHLFFAGHILTSKAIEAGQRVYIHIESGEVDGNPRHTKLVTQEAPVTAIPTEAAQPVAAKEGLAPAPLESISEQTDKGLVPTIGRDGLLPWKYYAKPYNPQGGKPMVAIVITDLGLSKPLTEDALKLPHNVTLSFSPYSSDARKWALMARGEGFETLADLPMQTDGYLKYGIDPGPYGLLADAGINENSARLRWVLSRFPGFIGVLAPQNESLTSDITHIRPTLTELAGHGVLLLYIKTPGNMALTDAIKAHQFNALGIDKVIDDDIAPAPIDKALDDLTALAKTQGYAIGFAHSYPPTLDSLARWADGLAAQNVDLVPVSAIGFKLFP